jgi:hypothetical protein
MRTVENAKPGTRNGVLFWAACRLAEIVAEGRLKVGVAAALLESGARLNGLWREDGADQCRATNASGFYTIEQALLSSDAPHMGGTREDATDGVIKDGNET